MPLQFVHESRAQRVVLARGRAAESTAAEVARLGAGRVLLVMAEGRESDATRALVGALPVVERWVDVRQHVPEELADRVAALATEARIDAIVSVGGGSATGLAKGIALATGIPIIAVPTTYSGSEATDIWGLTADATKRTGVDARVLPASVVYDSELSESLPVRLSVASGFNALAHCIDSLWAPGADPINRALALEGARALASALRGIVADPRDVDARDRALYGCYLAGMTLASAGSGLHHKICHVVGGTFGLPHAETHAVVLPHVTRLNLPGALEVDEPLARALDDACGGPTASSAADALDRLALDVGAPSRLADLGFTEADIEKAVPRILAVVPASNPVEVTGGMLARLLDDARVGRTHAPSSDRPDGKEHHD